MTDRAFEFMVRLLRAGYAVGIARVYCEAWDTAEYNPDPESLYQRLRKLHLRLGAEELYKEGIIRDVEEFLDI